MPLSYWSKDDQLCNADSNMHVLSPYPHWYPRELEPIWNVNKKVKRPSQMEPRDTPPQRPNSLRNLVVGPLDSINCCSASCIRVFTAMYSFGSHSPPKLSLNFRKGVISLPLTKRWRCLVCSSLKQVAVKRSTTFNLSSTKSIARRNGFIRNSWKASKSHGRTSPGPLRIAKAMPTRRPFFATGGGSCRSETIWQGYYLKR